MSAFDPVNSFLVAESGRIGPEIARRSFLSSPWNALVKRDVFPEAMGAAPSTLTWERTLPSTAPTWASHTYQIGSSSDLCSPAAVTIGEAQTLRSYSLQSIAMESSRICVETLRAPMAVKDQLGAMYKNLQENTAWAWKNKIRSEFIANSSHKVAIGSSSYSESASAMPVLYGGQLTPSLLEHFHLKLCRDGAGEAGAISRVDGVPVFPLIVGAETSRAILRAEGYRTDIRENSAMVPELLKPLGVRISLLGFAHMVDLLPPRYNVVGGAWVEIEPYVASAATYGNKYDINPAYESAEYEDAMIFHPDVFHLLFPKPITSPGGGTSFNPIDYSGTWKWLNYTSDDNKDNSVGFFRGLLTAAAKPVAPYFGYTLRHKRCSTPAYTTC